MEHNYTLYSHKFGYGHCKKVQVWQKSTSLDIKNNIKA